ncbi:MAG: amidohydrolase family protein [Clostridiales bacterium]|nr:amidohydrolase family protein [Clostridiales bacterium]
MSKRALLGTILAAAMAFVLAGASASRGQQAYALPDYDLLLRNGLVFDGSGGPAKALDVAIKGDTIVKVAPAIRGRAALVIDARGRIISPGFIDLHTHVDEGMYFRENRSSLNYLLQGVTTVVVGQCGGSAWPIFEKAEDLIKTWTAEGIGLNAAILVGHGQVRQIVMGMDNRAPTAAELAQMKALVKEAMEQGASGISTGLIYVPGSFARTDEVIELVKVVAPYKGIYHTHMRNEREKLLEAIKETVEISEKTGARAHISHFKVLGKSNWGLSKDACKLVEDARARGLTITADQYPYRFSNGYPYRLLIPREAWLGEKAAQGLRAEDVTNILDYLRDAELLDLYKKMTPFFPLSASHERFLADLPRQRLVSLVARSLVDLDSLRGPENARERRFFIDRLQDPAEAEKIRRLVRQSIEESVGAENIVVGIAVEKNLEGKTLAEVAAIKGKSIEDTAIDLDLMGAKCIPLQMGEEDIEYIMKKDYVGTGSDGTAPFYGIGLPHIRTYSTFLHKIKKYALERKAITLAHAIRSQTSLPASIMNWNDRGWIKEGYKADIVVLDLNNIKTPTSISNPHQYSRGVDYLVVNGQTVVEKGKWNGQLPGRVLKLKQS